MFAHRYGVLEPLPLLQRLPTRVDVDLAWALTERVGPQEGKRNLGLDAPSTWLEEMRTAVLSSWEGRKSPDYETCLELATTLLRSVLPRGRRRKIVRQEGLAGWAGLSGTDRFEVFLRTSGAVLDHYLDTRSPVQRTLQDAWVVLSLFHACPPHADLALLRSLRDAGTWELVAPLWQLVGERMSPTVTEPVISAHATRELRRFRHALRSTLAYFDGDREVAVPAACNVAGQLLRGELPAGNAKAELKRLLSIGSPGEGPEAARRTNSMIDNLVSRCVARENLLESLFHRKGLEQLARNRGGETFGGATPGILLGQRRGSYPRVKFSMFPVRDLLNYLKGVVSDDCSADAQRAERHALHPRFFCMRIFWGRAWVGNAYCLDFSQDHGAVVIDKLQIPDAAELITDQGAFVALLDGLVDLLGAAGDHVLAPERGLSNQDFLEGLYRNTVRRKPCHVFLPIFDAEDGGFDSCGTSSFHVLAGGTGHDSWTRPTEASLHRERLKVVREAEEILREEAARHFIEALENWINHDGSYPEHDLWGDTLWRVRRGHIH
jgi:hypothetical protein